MSFHNFLQAYQTSFHTLIVLFYTVRKRNLSEIGLISFQRGALKDIYFAVPLVAISISALFVGVNTDAFKASFSNLLLAVAVGFSEEIYFRGIIYHIWEKRSRKSAVVISALIFGVFHLMNVLVGVDVGYTVLQVIFAFFYGITLAIIVSIMESIWPCILLHFFHDLCAFMGNDASRMVEMIYVVVWILILVIYIVCMLKRQKKKGN